MVFFGKYQFFVYMCRRRNLVKLQTKLEFEFRKIESPRPKVLVVRKLKVIASPSIQKKKKQLRKKAIFFLSQQFKIEKSIEIQTSQDY